MRSKLARGIVVAALLAACGVGAAVAHRKLFAWKRFDIVDAGRLLRSGQLKDWQLRRAVARYDIKSVFSFTFSENSDEQKVCDELGVRRFFHYLPGDGVGPDEPYLRFLELVNDPANLPMLVHCSAGVQRTGGAVVLYRTLVQERRFDDAVREMIAKGNEGKPEQIEQLKRIHDRLRWPAATADAATAVR